MSDKSKNGELLATTSGSLAADMGRGKSHAPPSDAGLAELAFILGVLEQAKLEVKDIAQKVGCSDTCVRNWIARVRPGSDRGSFPSDGYMDTLRELAKSVELERERRLRHSPTKIVPAAEMGSRPRHERVTFAHSPEQIASWLRKSGDHMGELVQLRVPPEEGVRYPELEIAVWYNRIEIAQGVVGQDVIDGARNGRFEAQDCTRWDGVTWWKKLQDAEEQYAAITGGSSTQRTRPKLLRDEEGEHKDPKDPKDPKGPRK